MTKRELIECLVKMNRVEYNQERLQDEVYRLRNEVSELTETIGKLVEIIAARSGVAMFERDAKKEA